MADILKILSELDGVSGNEKNVREFIIDQIKTFADEISVDTMGNIIALKRGKKAEKSKKIMAVCSTDEAGMIVSGVTDAGYIKFKLVGNIDERVLVSKRVRVGENKVKGVIGMKAIHLQKRSERENTVAPSALFIDIGAKSKEDALKSVKLGDYIAFDTEFSALGDCVKGKALDGRIGCFALIEALRESYDDDIYACFTAQQEVGMRGAQIAAYAVKPDLAVILGSAVAADTYGADKTEYGASLGKGAVLSFMDARAIFDKEITDKIADMAKKEKIAVQPKEGSVGSSAGDGVILAGEGTRAVMAAIPCRYSHTPVCVVNKDDINALNALTIMILKKAGELI